MEGCRLNLVGKSGPVPTSVYETDLVDNFHVTRSPSTDTFVCLAGRRPNSPGSHRQKRVISGNTRYGAAKREWILANARRKPLASAGEFLLHKPKLPGMRCAQKQIQVRVEPRAPVLPSAFPVRTAEITHTFTEYFNRPRTAPLGSRIKNKLRAAIQADHLGLAAFNHGLDLYSVHRLQRKQNPFSVRTLGS
jgi:hypothetical protein